MSLLTLFTRSLVKQREVKAKAPSRSINDTEKAVHELEVLLRQCAENPLQAYIDRFGCRMEIHTELNEWQRACIVRHQAKLEADLMYLLKST